MANAAQLISAACLIYAPNYDTDYKCISKTFGWRLSPVTFPDSFIDVSCSIVEPNLSLLADLRILRLCKFNLIIFAISCYINQIF